MPVIHELRPWYIDGPDGYPDSTTEAIMRIERELVKAQMSRQLLTERAKCLLCDDPGIHVHAIVGESPLR